MEKEFGKELLDLAKEYNSLLASATKNTWGAAKIAFEMRKHFPPASKKGEDGWVKFCKTVLKRNYKTVASYGRSVEYMQQHEPQLLAGDLSLLPPVSIVSELASVKDEFRESLHAELFGAEIESLTDFRIKLKGLYDDPTMKKFHGKFQRGGTGSNWSKRPKAPDLQLVPKDKISECIKADRVRMLTVQDWDDETELTDDVCGIIEAHSTKMRDDWTIIMIPPCGKKKEGSENE